MSARSASRPTNAALGADRSSAGKGQPPTPAVSSPSLVHGTAKPSTGSEKPFNSSSPTESNRMPSSRLASIRTAGDARIPSDGALSHSRAASIDGIPKYAPSWTVDSPAPRPIRTCSFCSARR
jgi:hypothetical protein